MTRVIDLGNGYGRLEGYPTEENPLTFPLTTHKLSKLYQDGLITKIDFHQTLLDIGYTDKEAKWFVSVADVTIEQWKASLTNVRTI